jgi:hypothetical protein
MPTFLFQKASKRKVKARIAIDGPSGSGKTYSALIAATVLAEGGRIAVIDTEHGSASLYSDEFDFDVLELTNFNPRNYIESIAAAAQEGYAVVVIDSLSHAWEGAGGALELVEDATKRSKSGNSYTAWHDVTPLQRDMIDAMLQSKCHVIATMRSKMEYVQEKDNNGKTIIRKVGLAPVQRQGTEYEFSIVADMDTDHNLVVSKSRCKAMADKVQNKPDAKFWKVFLDWLNSGADDEPKTAFKSEIPPSPPAPDTVSAEPTSRKVDPSGVTDAVAPVKRPMVFRFTHRGQNEKVEHASDDDVVGNALTKEPLKTWFDEVIVKSFNAKTHYYNHIDHHFGKKSALNLTWGMLGCLSDHVIAGVEYPKEYNPTPKKEPKSKSVEAAVDPIMVEFVENMCKKFNVTELPAQVLSEITTAVKQGMFSLENKDDVDAIELTISEALPK